MQPICQRLGNQLPGLTIRAGALCSDVSLYGRKRNDSAQDCFPARDAVKTFPKKDVENGSTVAASCRLTVLGRAVGMPPEEARGLLPILMFPITNYLLADKMTSARGSIRGCHAAYRQLVISIRGE